MLSKKESAVLSVIYNKAINGSCLISYGVLFEETALKTKIKEKDFSAALNSLELGGYFELLNTERHGEKLVFITLLSKGRCFFREKTEKRRALLFRIALACMSAFITFTIGKILYAIFS